MKTYVIYADEKQISRHKSIIPAIIQLANLRLQKHATGYLDKHKNGILVRTLYIKENGMIKEIE